jgi:hypothetical protein
VECITLSPVTAPKRHTDPAGGPGEYLLVRRYGKVAKYVTGTRPRCMGLRAQDRTAEHVMAEVVALGVDLAELDEVA